MIVHEGLRRMVAEQEDVFYYLTVMNENYPHPALPEGAEEGILRGMHRVRETSRAPQVRLLGSGTILREVEAAAELLREDFEHRGRRLERHQLHRAAPRRARGRALEPRSTRTATPRDALGRRDASAGSEAPVVAATDYMKALPDGIRAWVPGRYDVLGTDGFGRSDYRRAPARASSRSTAATSPSRRCARSPTSGSRRSRRGVAEGDRAVRDRPRERAEPGGDLSG